MASNKIHKELDVPYWNVPHGILDPYVMKSSKLLKALFLKFGGKQFLENAACTIFSTRREQEKAESIFGDLKGEIVYWPVDPEPEDFVGDELHNIREKLDIPKEAIVRSLITAAK